MLFKFLTGKEISNLQTGLIFSQAAGLIWVFIGLMLLFPSDTITVNDGGPPAPLLVLIGVVRILLPIIMVKGYNLGIPCVYHLGPVTLNTSCEFKCKPAFKIINIIAFH